MVQVFQSASGAERLRRARAFVHACPASTELLLVGPSRDAVNDFVRALLGANRSANFGLHRFTSTQLAARLGAVELARRGLAPATPLGAEAVAARATFEALRANALTYFTPVARCPGFPRALASTLTELRMAGVRPDALAPVAACGADLAVLLRAYEEQLEAAAISDRAALFSIAAEIVGRRGEGPPFLDAPVLLLDLPIRSRAERELIAAIAARAASTLVTVPADDVQTAAALRMLGAAWLASDGAGDPSDIGRLRTYLFRGEDARPSERDPRGEVRFFSAPGEGRECVEIARIVVDEARQGTAFDDIAILLRSPDLYAGLLENALRRALVPAWFSRGTSRPDPSGRAFLALLACASEGLSARRFAEYLSLGQVPPLDISGAPAGGAVWSGADDEMLGAAGEAARDAATGSGGSSLADSGTSDAAEESPDPIADDEPVIEGTLRAPWKWEQLLVEASVVGGHDRWARRLGGLRAELVLKRREIARDEPDSPRLPRIDRDIRDLDHLRRFALPVIERLAGWPARAPWGEWLDACGALAPMVLRKPERVLTVLAELRPMAAIGPVTLDEARDVLTERLATLGYDPPARRYGRVFVGTPEQVRGRRFAVVFVPGLAERIFPQKLREDPMLLDEFRRTLSPDLTTTDHRLPNERLLLRLAAGAADQRLYLSYSRIELAEGRPRVPSLYALDVVRAITGRIPDHEQLEREAERFAQARLSWPAPEDAGRAIDEMEHDLAVLRRWMQHPDRKERRGRVRYLLALNPHLDRSLRGRWARWEQKKWQPADGLVRVADATRPVLAAHRLTKKPYSVSSLQKFATCPYQFLLSAIHRLEPRKEIAPIEQLDPLTRGSLFHAVQAAVLRALERRGALPVTGGNLAEALATLDAEFERLAGEYRERLVPAVQRVWQDELDLLRADLRAWLRRVVELDAIDGVGWDPIRFEYGFGLPIDGSSDPRSRPEPVTLGNGFLLHGRIDLIERRCRGSALRVTDHKTGSDRTKDGLVVGGGETLQPVLYALAVEAAWSDDPPSPDGPERTGGRVDTARLFYCTSAGRFNQRVVAIDEHARHRGIEVLQIVDRAVEQGVFPPAPRERACTWCDFHQVCGPHEEERAGYKDKRLIADLLALREYP